MSLTNEQIKLIQSTIPILKENGSALTDYFYNRMLNNHPELKNVFNMGHQRSGAQARALAGAVLAYAENITTPENLGQAVNLIAHKHVSLNIQPEQYSIVGENLLHSISEVLNISMDSEMIEAWAMAYNQLADILIGVEKQLYNQELQNPYGWNGWKEFRIIDKKEESSEITSFYLKPTDNSNVPAFQAGQYISVRVFVPELQLKQPRQYSLSDCSTKDYFRISVKKESAHNDLAEGYVSTTLHNNYQIGDIVEISNPTGNFVLQNPDKANVFISGGVGLTPMLAMLKTLSQKNHSQPISFIHACRNQSVLAMTQEIETLKNNMSNLSTYLACEEASEGFCADKIGHLDLTEVASNLLPMEADYYICGPKGFMQKQYQDLLNLGIAAENIHMELFGTGGVYDIAA